MFRWMDLDYVLRFDPPTDLTNKSNIVQKIGNSKYKRNNDKEITNHGTSQLKESKYQNTNLIYIFFVRKLVIQRKNVPNSLVGVRRR